MSAIVPDTFFDPAANSGCDYEVFEASRVCFHFSWDTAVMSQHRQKSDTCQHVVLGVIKPPISTYCLRIMIVLM